MDYKKTASDILGYVGGEENVSHFEHCSTRLRFTLKDSNKANVENLKKVKGVLGVVMAAQCQVIIGNSVVEVYDEILKIASFKGGGSIEDNSSKDQKLGAKIMDFIIGAFQPLVPAIAGAGVLKSLLSLFVLIGILDNTSSTYTVFNNIGDSALYFIPILVANSAAKKLKCNQMVATGIVGALLLPNMSALLTAEGGSHIIWIYINKYSICISNIPRIIVSIFISICRKIL